MGRLCRKGRSPGGSMERAQYGKWAVMVDVALWVGCHLYRMCGVVVGGRWWGCINTDARSEVGVSLSGGRGANSRGIVNPDTPSVTLSVSATRVVRQRRSCVVRLAINCITSILKGYIPVKQL